MSPFVTSGALSIYLIVKYFIIPVYDVEEADIGYKQSLQRALEFI